MVTTRKREDLRVGLEEPINASSMGIVKLELTHSLERVKLLYEASILNGEWQETLSEIKSIAGCLKVIPVRGAASLADEAVAAIEQLSRSELAPDQLASALSNAMVMLENMVRRAIDCGREVPMLAIPWVNDLRAARRKPFVAEADFSPVDIHELPVVTAATQQGLVQYDQSQLKSMHLMYQVGLLGVIRNSPQPLHFQLMLRGLKRLRQGVDGQLRLVLGLAAAVVEHMEHGVLKLTFTRLRLLAEIDRVLRNLIRGAINPLRSVSSNNIGRELLFLSALGLDVRNISFIDSLGCSIPALGFNDAEIQAAQSDLIGPDALAIEQLVAVIGEEMARVKDTLELAASEHEISELDLDQLISRLDTIGSTLTGAGFRSFKPIVEAQIAKLEAWRELCKDLNPTELRRMADSLLNLESDIEGLRTVGFSSHTPESRRRRRKASDSQLSKAEQIVVTEALSAMGLIKRALESYQSSGYDSGHIANLATTLRTVRGAMVILMQQRMVSILNALIENVERDVLAVSGNNNQAVESVATVADIVVSLEYALDTLQYDEPVDRIMDIAEESMATLNRL